MGANGGLSHYEISEIFGAVNYKKYFLNYLSHSSLNSQHSA